MIPALINLIVWLLIVGILVALVYWVLDAIPIPDPLNRIAKVVLMVLVVLVVVLMLLNLIGVSTGVQMPRLQ
jgi:glucan phosphoethanolaminetransferase (alkaline phosphatase superfamily)